MKKIIFLLVLVSFIGLGIFVKEPVENTIKTFSLINAILAVEAVPLDRENLIKEVYAQDDETSFYVFRPKDEGQYPGIVLSIGIHSQGAEHKNLQKLFNGLVKNGFVVLVVDSVFLKESLIVPREVENLVKGFKFLSEKPYVKSDKIGFLGLSVGSSLAFLASADPDIKDDVLYLVWIGGYYDLEEFTKDVLSQTFISNGKLVSWKPSNRIKDVTVRNLAHLAKDDPEFQDLIKEIEQASDRTEIEKLIFDIPEDARESLNLLSPKNKISEVATRVYIIHGIQDNLIPFAHSVNLSNNYTGSKRLVLSQIYGHQAPVGLGLKALFSIEIWEIIRVSNEIFGLLKK